MLITQVQMIHINIHTLVSSVSEYHHEAKSYQLRRNKLWETGCCPPEGIQDCTVFEWKEVWVQP